MIISAPTGFGGNCYVHISGNIANLLISCHVLSDVHDERYHPKYNIFKPTSLSFSSFHKESWQYTLQGQWNAEF